MQGKYVALLRGINVGGNRKVPMAELRTVFEAMGFTGVSTYINSGNVIFSADIEPKPDAIRQTLSSHFEFDIDVLVLSAAKVISVAQAIPGEWVNDLTQKSDVVYLFPDVDYPGVVTDIGYRPEFETIRYVPGALITNISRQNRGKASLLRMMGTPLYRRVTIRNATTARKLAELVK